MCPLWTVTVRRSREPSSVTATCVTVTAPSQVIDALQPTEPSTRARAVLHIGRNPSCARATSKVGQKDVLSEPRSADHEICAAPRAYPCQPSNGFRGFSAPHLQTL